MGSCCSGEGGGRPSPRAPPPRRGSAPAAAGAGHGSTAAAGAHGAAAGTGRKEAALTAMAGAHDPPAADALSDESPARRTEPMQPEELETTVSPPAATAPPADKPAAAKQKKAAAAATTRAVPPPSLPDRSPPPSLLTHPPTSPKAVSTPPPAREPAAGRLTPPPPRLDTSPRAHRTGRRGSAGSFGAARSSSAPLTLDNRSPSRSASPPQKKSSWFGSTSTLEEAIYYCEDAVHRAVTADLHRCDCGLPPTVAGDAHDVSLVYDIEEGITVQLYAPDVYRWHREEHGIAREQWLASWCTDFAVSGSAGKSGASFARSGDGAFFLKSLNDGELKVMRGEVARALLDHFALNDDTLINRPLALYTVNLRGKLFHLVALANVFNPQARLASTWDLKGSTQGRTSKADEHKKKVPLLKDNDWVSADTRIALPGAVYDALAATIRADVAFFARHDLMDYSLFVGRCAGDALDVADTGRTLVRPEAGGPAYFLGIIDYLQVYNTGKKIAHSVKGLLANVDTISTIPPTDYAHRFEKFMLEQVLERGK